MTDNYNVIGDIAGNALTLKALLEKMPQDAELISLGDPNDRGPRSKEVIEFLMTHGQTVQSNHAHMMVEEWKQKAMPGAHPRYYDAGLWPEQNGGMTTIFSYAADTQWYGDVSQLIPREHIEFLENCPAYIESENFIMTHAPIHITYSPDEASKLGNGFTGRFFDQQAEQSVLWNRIVPSRVNPKLLGKINLFGHNAHTAAKAYTTEFPNGIRLSDQDRLNEILAKKHEYPIYAIALDTSAAKVLTGLHLPTMTLYTQEYID